jgi:hypothetical protein
MRRTYAVTWEEPGLPRHAGKLELREHELSLEGRNNGSGPVTVLVPYDQLVELRLAPSGQRLDGRPTLVLDRGRGGALSVASIAAPGSLSEIADRLTELRSCRCLAPTGGARR